MCEKVHQPELAQAGPVCASWCGTRVLACRVVGLSGSPLDQLMSLLWGFAPVSGHHWQRACLLHSTGISYCAAWPSRASSAMHERSLCCHPETNAMHTAYTAYSSLSCMCHCHVAHDSGICIRLTRLNVPYFCSTAHSVCSKLHNSAQSYRTCRTNRTYRTWHAEALAVAGQYRTCSIIEAKPPCTAAGIPVVHWGP